jgi:hypothetical protein
MDRIIPKLVDQEIFKLHASQTGRLDIPSVGLFTELPEELSRGIYVKLFPRSAPIGEQNIKDALGESVLALSDPDDNFTYVMLYFAYRYLYELSLEHLIYRHDMVKWRTRFGVSRKSDLKITTESSDDGNQTTIHYTYTNDRSANDRVLKLIYEPAIRLGPQVETLLHSENLKLRKYMNGLRTRSAGK